MPDSYVVQSPSTEVIVQSPSTQAVVSAVGIQGRSGPTLPIVFNRAGTCLPLVGKVRYRFPFAATIIGVSAAMGSAPEGSDLTFDVLINGNVADEFAVLDGSQELPEQTTNLSISVGDYLTVNVTAVGSTVNGDDLSIFIRYIV